MDLSVCKGFQFQRWQELKTFMGSEEGLGLQLELCFSSEADSLQHMTCFCFFILLRRSFTFGFYLMKVSTLSIVITYIFYYFHCSSVQDAGFFCLFLFVFSCHSGFFFLLIMFSSFTKYFKWVPNVFGREEQWQHLWLFLSFYKKGFKKNLTYYCAFCSTLYYLNLLREIE